MQKNHKVLAVLACLALAAGTMAGCAPPAPAGGQRPGPDGGGECQPP